MEEVTTIFVWCYKQEPWLAGLDWLQILRYLEMMKDENINASQTRRITFAFPPAVFRSHAREPFVHLLFTVGHLQSPGLTGRCTVPEHKEMLFRLLRHLRSSVTALPLHRVTDVTQWLSQTPCAEAHASTGTAGSCSAATLRHHRAAVLPKGLSPGVLAVPKSHGYPQSSGWNFWTCL